MIRQAANHLIVCPALLLKIFRFSANPKSNVYFCHPIPKEGRFAVVTAGCDGRGSVRRANSARTNGAGGRTAGGLAKARSVKPLPASLRGTDIATGAMQAYLDWEYGLAEQPRRDATHGIFVI